MSRRAGLLPLLLAVLSASIVLSACVGYDSSPSGSLLKKSSKARRTMETEESGSGGDDEEGGEPESAPETETETGIETEIETEIEPETEIETPAPTAEPTAGKLAFPPLFASLKPTCGTCHLSGRSSAPKFFAADADATYSLFKARRFHLEESPLKTKGLHGGPELSATQLRALDAWIAAEE